MKIVDVQKRVESIMRNIGSSIIMFIIPARIIDLITLQELKTSVLVAAALLLLTAFVISKMKVV